jgi:cytochrome c553
MKGISVKLALGAAVVALVLSAPVEAGRYRLSHDFSARGKAQDYCMLCHGQGAHGYQGYRPIPQLAGQSAKYIEIQLAAFAEGRRQRDLRYVKYGRVHGISEGQRATLGNYLASLKPLPHKSGSADLIANGQKIFLGGAPENDVPACAVCHGPEGKGEGIFPRLAGQWRPYLVGQLTNWDKQRGLGPKGKDDNSQIMAPIAKSLSKEQIQAVSAYLSSLQ